MSIVQAVTWTTADAGIRALGGVLGVVFVALGIVCLRHVLLSLLAIATVIGLTCFLGGIVQLVEHHADRLADAGTGAAARVDQESGMSRFAATSVSRETTTIRS